MSGCAVAAGTARTMEMLGQDPKTFVPALFFEHPSLVDEALISLYLENAFAAHPPVDKKQYDAGDASEFRKIIIQNKAELQSHLNKLFGGSVTCPELIVEGARIIINANELGFKTAKDLCDALHTCFSIGTKPAIVYASPRKHREWGKYVQITVPWNDQMLEADLAAFNSIYQNNRAKSWFLRIIKNLQKRM